MSLQTSQGGPTVADPNTISAAAVVADVKSAIQGFTPCEASNAKRYHMMIYLQSERPSFGSLVEVGTTAAAGGQTTSGGQANPVTSAIVPKVIAKRNFKSSKPNHDERVAEEALTIFSELRKQIGCYQVDDDHVNLSVDVIGADRVTATAPGVDVGIFPTASNTLQNSITAKIKEVVHYADVKFSAVKKDDLKNLVLKAHTQVPGIAPTQVPGISTDYTLSFCIEKESFKYKKSSAATFSAGTACDVDATGDGIFKTLNTVNLCEKTAPDTCALTTASLTPEAILTVTTTGANPATTNSDLFSDANIIHFTDPNLITHPLYDFRKSATRNEITGAFVEADFNTKLAALAECTDSEPEYHMFIYLQSGKKSFGTLTKRTQTTVGSATTPANEVLKTVHFPSATGADALKNTFLRIFEELRLEITCKATIEKNFKLNVEVLDAISTTDQSSVIKNAIKQHAHHAKVTYTHDKVKIASVFAKRAGGMFLDQSKPADKISLCVDNDKYELSTAATGAQCAATSTTSFAPQIMIGTAAAQKEVCHTKATPDECKPAKNQFASINVLYKAHASGSAVPMDSNALENPTIVADFSGSESYFDKIVEAGDPTKLDSTYASQEYRSAVEKKDYCPTTVAKSHHILILLQKNVPSVGILSEQIGTEAPTMKSSLTYKQTVAAGATRKFEEEAQHLFSELRKNIDCKQITSSNYKIKVDVLVSDDVQSAAFTLENDIKKKMKMMIGGKDVFNFHLGSESAAKFLVPSKKVHDLKANFKYGICIDYKEYQFTLSSSTQAPFSCTSGFGHQVVSGYDNMCMISAPGSCTITDAKPVHVNLNVGANAIHLKNLAYDADAYRFTNAKDMVDHVFNKYGKVAIPYSVALSKLKPSSILRDIETEVLCEGQKRFYMYINVQSKGNSQGILQMFSKDDNQPINSPWTAPIEVFKTKYSAAKTNKDILDVIENIYANLRKNFKCKTGSNEASMKGHIDIVVSSQDYSRPKADLLTAVKKHASEVSVKAEVFSNDEYVNFVLSKLNSFSVDEELRTMFEFTPTILRKVKKGDCVTPQSQSGQSSDRETRQLFKSTSLKESDFDFCNVTTPRSIETNIRNHDKFKEGNNAILVYTALDDVLEIFNSNVITANVKGEVFSAASNMMYSPMLALLFMILLVRNFF